MKTCSVCKIKKEDTDFTKGQPKCKSCIKIYNKQYREANEEKVKKQKKEYYQENKEEIKGSREENKEEINKKKRKYYQENKKEINEKKKDRGKIYREENKEEIRERKKKFYQENKEEIKKYQQKNKEIISEQKKKYREENIEKVKEYEKEYSKERRKTDPAFKLRHAVSTAINYQLNKNGSSKNGASINQYLPYTIEQLQDHLESQFSLPENLTPDGQIWMTWENRGIYYSTKWNENDPSTWVWQLDHKEPQSDFNITSMDSQEFRDCWALTNLRPLSAKINQLDGATRIRHKKDNQ